MLTASRTDLKQPIWQTIALFTLALWLGGSLILDLVVMPGLYATGMMATPSFASTGYVIFGIFNRLELIFSAVVLSSEIAYCRTQHTFRGWNRTAVIGAGLLLAVVLIYTYGLVPQMSAMGMSLNLFQPTQIPVEMMQLQGGYWLLELVKLAVGFTLLGVCYRRQSQSGY